MTRGRVRGALIRVHPVRPLGGNERPALVRQDQQEVELTAPLGGVQDLKGLAFKWMPAADNGDLVGKVFEMGNVS